MRRRFVVPVAFASIAALAVVVAPALAPSGSRDIMLASVPDSVQSGATLPIVAEVVRDADDPSGGRNVSTTVEARLVDASGTLLARADLPASIDGRSRGMVTIPAGRRGVVFLQLRARLGDDAPRLRARIDVGTSPRRVMPSRRSRVIGVSPVSEALLVRAEGGACAPGYPCRVYVSEPPSSPDATYGAGEGTTLLDQSREGDRVRFLLRIEGFGGRLVARFPDGEPIDLGVPVQLGAARFVAQRAFLRTGAATLVLERGPSSGTVQIDRYVDGRWLETQVFRASDLGHGAAWPTRLSEGVHRFEARDASGASIGSTLVVVDLGPARAQRRAAWSSADDPWKQRRAELLLTDESLDDEIRAASALGLLQGSLERPTQLDSRVQRAMGSTESTSTATVLLASAVVVLGFGAAYYVAREGRRAKRQADALIEDAESLPSRYDGLEALLPWTILLAFVAAAVMILQRG